MIRGVVGIITWAYYRAAALEGYAVTRPGGAWRLEGTIVDRDPFKLAQQPLMFNAPTKLGTWRWPILELEIVADRITARLGPPEKPS